ncbi:polyprenyl synthetase family protein [Clostridium sp. MD294]|uniref:polyprenyl synthetase family protein n=1 Tax=Clostridium sp. MD294 TaxID=97138 RepID=UPI0002CA7234|nr:farnesyl diphosphate synthase [Clostridium sp. MD294]NDO46108.1 polyprenyl synthetase family protein [Clostridium sp. MD294]USF30226.1 Farnesyl diphosphate synthase [Clostridium sp. MD294]
MNCKEQISIKAKEIDDYLQKRLPQQSEYPSEIFEAMRYSIFAGGKRLRPILLLSACEALGGETEKAIDFACAIEMIHTYSLIHDDLPAMDNDDYRRGMLTSHKKFGEATAILAGDGLLHHAFEIMSNACVKDCTIQTVKAMQSIAHGAGVYGMLSGQVVDVLSEGKQIDEKTMYFIHKNKTAAMLQGALKAGAILAGATQKQIEMMEQAGEKIGVAFQIADDILDITSTLEELGKPVHSDEKNEKNTYITMYGIEKSKQMVETLSQQAISLFEELGENANFLIELTKYLIDRKN